MKENEAIQLDILLERTGQRHDVLIPAAASFDQLHQEIQKQFGWDNSHLYQFIVDGQYFVSEYQDEILDGDCPPKGKN